MTGIQAFRASYAPPAPAYNSTSDLRWAGLKGLTTTSFIPARWANCLVLASASAVKAMIGKEAQDASLDRQARAASSPERPGMCTSSNTKNGSVCAIRASASSALEATSTAYPQFSSMRRATKTFNSLSSTTSTGASGLGRWADGV